MHPDLAAIGVYAQHALDLLSSKVEGVVSKKDLRFHDLCPRQIAR